MSTSVVIVTHESEQYITSTLTAVFALADRAGQVIVVDNASTDGTIDAISAFPVHLIEHVDAPSVRLDDQVVVPRVDDEVVHGGGRESAP